MVKCFASTAMRALVGGCCCAAVSTVCWPDAALAQTAPPGPAQATSFVAITTTNPRVTLERRIGSLDERVGPTMGGVPAPGAPPPAHRPPPSWGPYWEPEWERVCPTPCRTQVALAGEYRVGGEGVTPSEPFRLRPGAMSLDVDPGSSSARNAGLYMTVFGFLLAGTGAVFLVLGLSSSEEASGDINETMNVVSAIGLGTGAAVGLTGIVLVVANSTSVRDERGGEIAAGMLPVGAAATGRF